MNELIEKRIFLLNLNRILLYSIHKEMKTYGAIILVWLLSVWLFARFHLEQKRRRRSVLTTLLLVYWEHFLFAVCFVIVFPLPHILLLLFSLQATLFSFFYGINAMLYWKLLMLNVVLVVIIIAVDRYECGKRRELTNSHSLERSVAHSSYRHAQRRLYIYFFNVYVLFEKGDAVK